MRAHSRVLDMILKHPKLSAARQPFRHLTTVALGGLMAYMMTAKFALLIAQMPQNPIVPKHKTGGEEVDSWQRFLSTSPKVSDTTKGLTVLQNNVWQIDLSIGMRALCDIWVSADNWGIPMRVLFLEEIPAWLEYPEHDAIFP